MIEIGDNLANLLFFGMLFAVMGVFLWRITR